jgi:hypothetical protein
MTETKVTYEAIQPIERVIFTVRGQRVMLDSDLAKVYGVTTFNLNKAVRRNADRFPDDFAFQITAQEVAKLIFQIGISNSRRGGRRKPAWVYTEHGAVMAANVLNSKRAAQMSVGACPERSRTGGAQSERLDIHEAAIVSILQRVMDIIDPPALPAPPKKQIGFQVRERAARYVVRRKAR